MLALVFAKLCHKFMIAHALLSVCDLLIARRSETLGQPGPWQFQISNLPFFLFKIDSLYSLGVLQLRLQTTPLFLPPVLTLSTATRSAGHKGPLQSARAYARVHPKSIPISFRASALPAAVLWQPRLPSRERVRARIRAAGSPPHSKRHQCIRAPRSLSG